MSMEKKGVSNNSGEKMNGISKLLLVAASFGGFISTATAANVVYFSAVGPGLGSFSYEQGPVDILGNSISTPHFSLTFDSANPITLFVRASEPEHSFVPGGFNDFSGTVINNTTTTITGFHMHLDNLEDSQKEDMVFRSFEGHSLFGPQISGFTLDSPSKDQPLPFEETGPRDLNFSGALKVGAANETSFGVTKDPWDYQDSYSFKLTISPTVGVVPEPESYAMLLAGLGLLSLMRLTRKLV